MSLRDTTPGPRTLNVVRAQCLLSWPTDLSQQEDREWDSGDANEGQLSNLHARTTSRYNSFAAGCY